MSSMEFVILCDGIEKRIIQRKRERINKSWSSIKFQILQSLHTLVRADRRKTIGSSETLHLFTSMSRNVRKTTL